MTDEILKLIEERRNLKNKDRRKYKEVQKDIKYKCRQAKEKCTEIENLQRMHYTHSVHKKIKGERSSRSPGRTSARSNMEDLEFTWTHLPYTSDIRRLPPSLSGACEPLADSDRCTAPSLPSGVVC